MKRQPNDLNNGDRVIWGNGRDGPGTVVVKQDIDHKWGVFVMWDAHHDPMGPYEYGLRRLENPNDILKGLL